MLTTVFFDAGNTLVFADHSKTLAPLEAAGFHPTFEQLYAAERFTKKRLDAAMSSRDSVQSVDQDFWSIYYTHLIQLLVGEPSGTGLRPVRFFQNTGRRPVSLEALVADSVAATRRSGNWSRVLPGTREVLLELRARGLRLGVISNSDGGIENILRVVGLGDCFDSFTDSGKVGVEKPNPAIFRHAMASLDARPEASMYVGDSYALDYQGAQAAGMRAILMDAAGTYRDDPYLRIGRLGDLLGLL